jgi:hypothetical protein
MVNPTRRIFPAAILMALFTSGLAHAGDSRWIRLGPELGYGEAIGALAIDPTSPQILYAGTLDSQVLKSTNGGGSWIYINTGLTYSSSSKPAIHVLAVDPMAPQTLYAGTGFGGGVFKSTNGGGNWSAVNTGLTWSEIQALVIDRKNPQTLYAGAWRGAGVFKSTNGGNTWSAINTGMPSA